MIEISQALISKALDGLSLRYRFTAQNIANANTPDYAAVQVTFEDSLKAAAAKGPQAIMEVQPKIQSSTGSSAPGEMRLDLELASASQTAMRYRALLDVLGRQMALNQAVLSEGR